MSTTTTDPSTDVPPRRPRAARSERHVLPLLMKILVLGTVIGTVVALTPALVGQGRWVFLVLLWVVGAVVVATYATSRGVPAKYLLPGTLFLALLVVFPILLTAQTSTTNLGDGTRNTKEQTIASIVGASVVQTPDAPRYALTVGTQGSVTTGPFTYFLVNEQTGEAFAGTEEGLEPAPDAVVENGKVTAAPGYTLLTPVEVNAAQSALEDFSVPTDNGAIRALGFSTAFEGRTTLTYDESSDTITDTRTGTVYSPKQFGDRSYFVDDQGARVSDQSWGENVGLANYSRALTDPQIRGDFLRIFVWTVVFATLSVVTTFLLGLALAVTMNDPRLRGQKVYRALLILPYAIPGFISLLLWSSFFNTDFGLVNQLTGLDVNWFSGPTTAKIAVVLTNLWMGFPYMFLVCTGALQSIPEELREAATIDGASGFYGFRKITFPLLLVTVAPLLVATFAFNFNNFNAIQLLTEGGPFSPDNPTAGATDILISYTIRLAFGASGAQIGFASAISVLLFIITGVIAAIQFRYTRALEDVN